jgi:hypothetical protein
MMDIYWYISEAKLASLQATRPGFLSGVSAEVAFKFPFLEGKLSGSKQASTITNLEKLVKRFRTEEKISAFDDVKPTELPKMVWFSGPAGRLIDDDAFWLAMKGDRNALLLAGSAGYAIGKPPSTSAHISPSVDPVNALRAAFGQGPDVPFLPLATRLTYAWQEIAKENLIGAGVPSVEGLAFVARTVVPDLEQLKAVGCEKLSLLLIGTPLYVKQV